MNTQELRLGNWVRVKNIEQWVVDVKNEFEVCGITELIHLKDRGMWNVRQIEPIELTEEWLHKFGFVTHDRGFIYQLDALTFIILEPTIYEDEGKGFDCFLMATDEHCIALNYLLKSVHQIQNLFFNLSYTELQIK